MQVDCIEMEKSQQLVPIFYYVKNVDYKRLE